MTTKTIEEVINHIQTFYGNTQGCSIEEFNKLEQHYNIALPNTYKQFLLHIGNGADNYMKGSDYKYRWLLTLKDAANKILSDEGLDQLPNNSFVFWMHQGYQFCFFYTDSDDNPIIYYVNQCAEAAIINLNTCLTDFLYDPHSILNDNITKVSYRLLLSTWGIAIDMGIATMYTQQKVWDKDHDIIKVSELIYVVCKKGTLSTDGLNYFCNGLHNVKGTLDNIINEPTYYYIADAIFSHTDYQDEGMYNVAISFLNTRYSLAIQLPEVSFSRDNNHYNFHFTQPINNFV